MSVCAADFEIQRGKQMNTSNQTTIHSTAKPRRSGKMWRRTAVAVIFTEMTTRGYSRWERFLSTHSHPSVPPSWQLPPADLGLKRQRSLHRHSSSPIFFNQMRLIPDNWLVVYWSLRLLTVAQSKLAMDHSDVKKWNKITPPTVMPKR